MQNAKYFCCGVLADEKLYRHYALNVPLYTHFTSPIRRYPDILVHRTLAAALGKSPLIYINKSETRMTASDLNQDPNIVKVSGGCRGGLVGGSGMLAVGGIGGGG